MLTHDGGQRDLTHVGYNCDLSHAGSIERELTHVGVILGSLRWE